MARKKLSELSNCLISKPYNSGTATRRMPITLFNQQNCQNSLAVGQQGHILDDGTFTCGVETTQKRVPCEDLGSTMVVPSLILCYPPVDSTFLDDTGVKCVE